MTHRRRIGVLIIGVVAVLVAVAANVYPHWVSGTAQPAPVPGPPAVGDCVLNPLPGPPPVTVPVVAASGGTVPVYPAQQIQSCTGLRYGEVVAVIPIPMPTVVKGDANGLYLDDPNKDSCSFSTQPYLGEDRKPVDGLWSTYLSYTVAMSKPSLRQEAAGQHWVACLVALPPRDPAASRSATQRYSGSIRGALQTGKERNLLGACSVTLEWRGQIGPGNCARPHSMEMLAFGGSGDHPVSLDQVRVSCQQLIRHLTGIPDPTAGGALSVRLYVEDKVNGTVITTPQIPASANLNCGVTPTGNRKLGSSLIAWGRQPIPWA